MKSIFVSQIRPAADKIRETLKEKEQKGSSKTFYYEVCIGIRDYYDAHYHYDSDAGRIRNVRLNYGLLYIKIWKYDN